MLLITTGPGRPAVGGSKRAAVGSRHGGLVVIDRANGNQIDGFGERHPHDMRRVAAHENGAATSNEPDD